MKKNTLKQLWFRLTIALGSSATLLSSSKAFANYSQVVAKYGPSPIGDEMQMLYGITPVYEQPTFWEILGRVTLYIILPVAVIILIIIGIKRSKNSKRK